MPYLGNTPATNFHSPPAVVRFSGDGSDTTFALGRTVGSVQEILVSVDGVVQDSAAYTVPDGLLSPLLQRLPTVLTIYSYTS